MMPERPKSRIMESESTNGGETTGRMDTTLKSPLMNLVFSWTYSST